MIRPFRVILIMVTLMIIGVAMIPLLNVQYMPSVEKNSLTITYSWRGASAKVIESQVTSKVEGVIGGVRGVEKITSISSKENGNVKIEFKEGVDVDAVRFEISTKIRSLYKSLPDGVSYPELSSGVRGNELKPVLIYTISANMPTWDIQKYVQNNIVNKLSAIHGVETVDVSGANPWQWVVVFDPQKCLRLGISSEDISSAFRSNSTILPLGICKLTENGEPISVNLAFKDEGPDQWYSIEIKNVEGNIVQLEDIAQIKLEEQPARSYRRINGLNNINLVVYASPNVNNITLASEVKKTISNLGIPTEYSLILASDSTVYINNELDKIYSRTGLSILILLLFVYLTSRNLRYLLLIISTLVANILIAFIFYNLLGLTIHLYSLAGITVSLGMVIDTSIIMIDHYSRFKNRKVFLAILAALLTTIGALSIVYFLPEAQRANLVDFAVVIIINLFVSLVISVLFIPALVDRFPIRFKKKKFSTKGKRRVSRFTKIYSKFIFFSRKHKWAYIILAILLFGLPIHMLPTKVGKQDDGTIKPDSTLNLWQQSYNSTVGSNFYQQTLKPILEPALGGSLRLFAKDIFSSYESTTPERTKIYIHASLPEGCTIEQLDETMRNMEAFLSQFNEIDIFTTSINSHSKGVITVSFTKEADKNGFAFRLKDEATSKAISLGGADWSIYGVGQGFNNSLSSGWLSNAIELKGYNYDQLYRIAEQVCETISVNFRVQGAVVAADRWDKRLTEYYLDFDLEKFSLYKISPKTYFDYLQNLLHSSIIGNYYNDSEQQNVVLKSSLEHSFDVWHMENERIDLDSVGVKLSEFGVVQKRVSGNNIYKTDQQYSLCVAFDFVGSTELAQQFEQQQIERLKQVLPVGYSVTTSGWRWWGEDDELPYALLVLVVSIIFFVCAVLFESLKQPIVIITLIPISFIGVFLTFYLFKLPFDQGGFASFVMLSGIVVNAGIYLVNEYNVMRIEGAKAGLVTYLKCYNRKIVPITLTVISTVLGLLPFVVISREAFWFSFAAGTMGGMLFSLIAIIIFLPIFLPLKNKVAL